MFLCRSIPYACSSSSIRWYISVLRKYALYICGTYAYIAPTCTYAYGIPYVFMALDHFGFPSSVPIPRLNPSRFHFSGPVLALSCPYKLEYKTLRKVTG